jgi:hypothetical protein
MIALSVAALGGIGYGKYESAKYDAYVSKAEAADLNNSEAAVLSFKPRNFLTKVRVVLCW